MAISYKSDLEKRLKDSEFRKEYNDLQPELAIIQMIIDQQNNQKLSLKELSHKTGISLSTISKLQRGSINPTIKLLQKLANGLDMDLELRFVPKSK